MLLFIAVLVAAIVAVATPRHIHHSKAGVSTPILTGVSIPVKEYKDFREGDIVLLSWKDQYDGLLKHEYVQVAGEVLVNQEPEECWFNDPYGPFMVTTGEIISIQLIK